MSGPDAGELELAFYERFFWAKGLEPYPVQEQALARIFAGDSVLVSVPTGTGKTVLGKAAISAALARGQRAVYTSPLRALTEEKYREFCEDFGKANVGFATGDYKVNREAPVQVEVAEILWNRIFGGDGAARSARPADVVVMDEAHYFNDPERGYVWEQSIIGLDPATQLVLLSATVGRADKFCHWAELVRRVPLHLVESRERKVPLVHQFLEEPLLDVVKELAHRGDVPTIIFVFGREQCFEVARLLKSCRRFTTDEEKAAIEARCDDVLLSGGVAKELRALLVHGIGLHHAGILPQYKQLVEELTLARLLRFVVSTETIAAGINLPAKCVVFPALRKFIKKEARFVTPAEFHQMAGRAGRPQFDDKGLAIALAPEEVVTELRREQKTAAKKGGFGIEEDKLRRSVYGRLRLEAQKRGDVLWTPEVHAELVAGEPAQLASRTKITAEQVLAIGLPDLATTALPGQAEGADQTAAVAAAALRASLPASLRLDIVTVIDHLLLDDRAKREQHKTLAQLVANMRAIGVIDEHGVQVAGRMIRQLQGVDALFVYHTLWHEDLDYEALRELVEYLVDHDTVQRALDRKLEDKKREWVREKLRELREGGAMASWEDAEAAYDAEFPRPVTRAEESFGRFTAAVPHPELHGGKKPKNVWAQLEDEGTTFMRFCEKHDLQHEEGNVFSYLVRVMNTANKLHEASHVPGFASIAARVRDCLSRVDVRLDPDPRHAMYA